MLQTKWPKKTPKSNYLCDDVTNYVTNLEKKCKKL